LFPLVDLHLEVPMLVNADLAPGSSVSKRFEGFEVEGFKRH
jgi:hypothetical protein